MSKFDYGLFVIGGGASPARAAHGGGGGRARASGQRPVGVLR
jgi:hypothetical protein